MMLWKNALKLLVSEEGPTTTEYAVMLALIVLVSVSAISGIGVKVSDVFASVDSGVVSAGAS